MKYHLLTAAVLAATLSGVAHAQDAAAAGGVFTGLRVEGRLGYDRVDLGLDGNDVGAPDDFDFDDQKDGLLYGAGVGYDFDFGGAVVGVEAGIEFTTAKFNLGDLGGTPSGLRVETERDIEVGGRVGYKVGPNMLLYGKGGYTNLKFGLDFDDSIPDDVQEDIEEQVGLGRSLDGYRLGAGVEYLFGTNTYGKVEYRYSNYEAGISRNQVVGAVGIRF